MTFWFEARDPALEVGGGATLLAECGGGQHEIGLLRRFGGERVDRDDSARTGHGATGQIRIGAVVDRVGTQQHEQIETTLGGGPQRGERIVFGIGWCQTEL